MGRQKMVRKPESLLAVMGLLMLFTIMALLLPLNAADSRMETSLLMGTNALAHNPNATVEVSTDAQVGWYRCANCHTGKHGHQKNAKRDDCGYCHGTGAKRDAHQVHPTDLLEQDCFSCHVYLASCTPCHIG